MTKRRGKSGTIDVKALLREDEEFVRALVRTALQEVLEAEMTELDRRPGNVKPGDQALPARVGECSHSRHHRCNPAERLVSEKLQLQPVPTPYGRRTVRSRQVKPDPVPIIGMQHSLSLYDAFAGGVR